MGRATIAGPNVMFCPTHNLLSWGDVNCPKCTQNAPGADSGGFTPPAGCVDHPPHYGGDTPFECIKVIEAWGLGFVLGNVVKYISRAGKKPGTSELQDLRQARWYLDREIAAREATR